MGAAPLTQQDCGGAIYVFIDRIRDAANMHQLDTALVMGHAIAHEIGHLLLSTQEHSAEGLMRSPWNAHDFQQAVLGVLLFPAPDVEAVRHAASMCCPDSLDPSACQ